MFALRVSYLTGLVYSSAFEDGDLKQKVEWPPHPSRLFSALVSAWGDGGAEEDLRPALEWLEGQPSPVILASEVDNRKNVQAFVPVNDAASLPERRDRKGRTFPSAALRDPDVYFVWNSSPPDDIAARLDRILLRTRSLGHPATLVSIQIAAPIAPGGLIEWEPDDSGRERLRVPQPGRLAELVDRYRRFEADPRKVHRPSFGKTALYRIKAQNAPTLRVAQTLFRDIIILRRDTGPRASLTSTLALTTAVRSAMQALAPQPPAEFISGHAPASTPDNSIPSSNPHIALVPLAHVGAMHATGDLLGIGALLPGTLSPAELQVSWKVLRSIEELGMAWGRWKVSFADSEERRRALRPETWTREHDVWSTVTPFVFDRYPKDPYGAEAERVVREAFPRVGLPEPVELDLHYNPWHRGVPKASAFPPARRPGRPQRYHCHVWARFADKVRGPVIAGAGRFYGYGLFQPLWGA